MFGSMSTHGHFSKEDTRSVRDRSHDSSWISVFSMVSRPAWSLLQKYLPGRTQAADMGNSLVGGLGDPSLKVAYLHCHRENEVCASPGDPGTLAWLTHDSLSQLTIQHGSQTDFNTQRQASVGYLGTARNFLSQVLMNASTAQEKRLKGAEGHRPEVVCCTDTATARSSNGRWWNGPLGVEDSYQNWLLNRPQNTNETGTNWQHCGEHHSVAYCQSHSQASIAMTTELCVCRDDGASMNDESAGPSCSTMVHNAGLRTEFLTNSHQLPLVDDEQLNVFQPLVCNRTYSEVAVLTPDQDNGYSSLEEEHSNIKLCSMRLLTEEQVVSESDGHVASGDSSSHSDTTGNESVENCNTEPGDCQDEIQQQEKDSESETDKASEGSSSVSPAPEDPPVLPNPHCQNKSIAYIMGSPCSDESESEDDSDWDSNDDDGFDSEGSSDLSESEDNSDDESDTDEEDADSETERLWNSLCQNEDPYNPRNFTAPMRTASNPNPSTESPVSESPPAHMSSHLSPSPLSASLSENESSEEVDEDENLKLWNSFSCSADPYSLLNFQAPIQTQKIRKSCQKKTPPYYKREEAEERLDSGFSEISSGQCSSGVMVVQLKKVQFVEEVEEFYASSDEDRHGPWEEIARDRCRFQRRVQEVEETISYCLSPMFRLVVFQRLFNAS